MQEQQRREADRAARGTSTRPRVLLVNPVPAHILQQIQAACDVQQHAGRGRPSRDEIVAALPDVAGIMTSNQVAIDNDLIAANPQLRVLSNNGVGYDNVDVPFATAHGLLVCNTPNVLNDAVADLTMAFILALSRRLLDAHGHVASGAWSGGRLFPLGFDLKDKTLGLLGFGRIGHGVAARARVFGLNVVYYDPVRDYAAEAAGHVIYAERDDLLRSADLVSVHVFLDASTRRSMGEQEFELMKPSAYLINTSRGPVVDQQALVAALRSGRIAGAALDVFETEPIPAGDPLLSAPNVLLAPHMASGTAETRMAMVELAARNLVAGVTGGTPEAMVNPEVLHSHA